MVTTSLVKNRDSASALSIALITLSAPSLISVCVYYVTRCFRVDWSATPLLWLLFPLAAPAICSGGGLSLMDAHMRGQLSWLEGYAWEIVILPVALGSWLSVWVVKGLFWMSGHVNRPLKKLEMCHSFPTAGAPSCWSRCITEDRWIANTALESTAFKLSISRMVFVTVSIAGLLLSSLPALADEYESKPNDSAFAIFNPRKAPDAKPLMLKPGDRLAIIGDSITEQKKYSQIIETYLTVCVPELKIATRQLGWSGETAEGFRKRMDQDCLRFHPTVATLCYGMNDCRYRPFDYVNGEWYRSNYTAVVTGLEAVGARVVLGSPGCAGKVPSWVKTKQGTLDELNLNLCTLRDIDIGIAEQQKTSFADMFWTLLKAGVEGKEKYSTADQSYEINGKDGIHPDWAGHLVMAYTFLRAMGMDGNIGTLKIDLANQTASASAGHKIVSFTNNELAVVSTRYPYCVTGESNRDNSIRSGATLVPFFQDLDRFLLIVTNAAAPKYQVIWGAETNVYSRSQLAAGINLAEDFETNPFSQPFALVSGAIAKKQAYETYQIKKVFHGSEGQTNFQEAVKRTETERARLVENIAREMKPVGYTIRIQACD